MIGTRSKSYDDLPWRLNTSSNSDVRYSLDELPAECLLSHRMTLFIPL